MRAIVLAGLLLLGGCAAQVPMAELEQQAMLTGDWSAVEKRERQIARRAERNGPDCGHGLVSYCVENGGHDRCSCITGQNLRDMFSSRR